VNLCASVSEESEECGHDDSDRLKVRSFLPEQNCSA
jgi:hypothetical protein